MTRLIDAVHEVHPFTTGILPDGIVLTKDGHPVAYLEKTKAGPATNSPETLADSERSDG
jgi:hypothetical protein